MVRKAYASRPRGSITLLALSLTTVMAIALASYLALCSRSNDFSTRQLQQDKVRELAQVGLEEALWALNQKNWTSSGPGGNTAWSISGPNRTVTLSYPMSGATGQVVLTVTIPPPPPPPTPPTTWPSITAMATLTESSGRIFKKTLHATTGPAPLFGNAIASAESHVRFDVKGTVDSWNSDPNNNGSFAGYSVETPVHPNNYAAVVAGRDDGSGAWGVRLEQAEVKGYVATFGHPVYYSTSGNPPAKVLGPTSPSGTTVDLTRVGKSAFVPVSPVFTVSTPSPTGTSSVGGLLAFVGAILELLLNVVKINDDVVINGDEIDNVVEYIAAAALPFLFPGPSIVIERPTQMVVNGNFTISGIGRVRIATTGSLELFINGNINIGGNGFENETNDPKKLAIYSTGTGTSAITYTSTQDFCGVIYSENKPITISQNGPFYGALLSRKYIRFTSPTSAPVFHYDLALRQRIFPSVTTPYVIRQVTEP
ncbi:MAG: hypothetical protein V4773_13125 [Verrucomicrobiota bacterium]